MRRLKKMALRKGNRVLAIRAMFVGGVLRLALCLSAFMVAEVAVAKSDLSAPPAMDKLTIVVPSETGTGWDRAAKAMKVTLQDENIVRRVEIVNYPGAGGLVGLSQFYTLYRGRSDVLMLGGLVMLGSALRDESAVGVRNVTPIARLTSDWGILVTKRDSPIQSVATMRDMLIADPSSVRFAGGSLGGPDQGLVWRIAQAIGVPLDQVTFLGRIARRRVPTTVIEGRAAVGLSGYSEFATSLADKQLRILAVAAPRRLPGIDAPTLRESGIDVVMMNWRGVFAAPGVTAVKQDRLSAMVGRMARSERWQGLLRDNHWTDNYQDGMAFGQFIDREQERWSAIVNPPARTTALTVPAARVSLDLKAQAMIIFVFLAVMTLAALLKWRLSQRRQQASELEVRLRELTSRVGQKPCDPGQLVKGGIDHDFSAWKLTMAESDVGWFMLRGLPMKEIANLRGTSERTVRQQAQSIYRKAGLDGRSDLAGRVLERFI